MGREGSHPPLLEQHVPLFLVFSFEESEGCVIGLFGEEMEHLKKTNSTSLVLGPGRSTDSFAYP